MSNWRVVIPEATTNLCTNPSIELDTTGWIQHVSNTLARDTTVALFGNYSLKATFINDKDLADYPVTLTADTYTFTAYVYIPSDWNGGLIRLSVELFTGVTIDQATTTTTLKDQWVRLSVIFTPDSGDLSGNLIIETDTNPSSGKFIFIDGVQIEKKDHETTYCDGDQDGCSWDGAEHTSKSSRTAASTAGGRPYNLADLGFAIEEIYGAGMPPVQHLTVRRALIDGEEYQRARVMPRTLQLRSTVMGSTLATYHSSRRTLISAIRPDDQHQPFIFRYGGAGGLDREILARYERGLELKGPSGYNEQFAAQFIAHEPYFQRVGGVSKELGNRVTFNSYGLVRRKEGQWSNAGVDAITGNPTYVFCFALDYRRGYLFVGGDFTNFDGVSGANNIAKMDLETGVWSTVGAASAINDTVWDMILTSANDLVIGGAFTNAGGVAAADMVARWNSASGWTAIGAPGEVGYVGCVAQGSDGSIYVGGNFSNLASIANADNIAKWTGSAWQALGTGSDTGYVSRIIFDKADYLYACGSFTDMGGVSAADYIAKWTGAAWQALHATPMTSNIDDIVLAPDGSIYCCGGGNTWNSVTINGISRWNGSTFLPVGGGIQGSGEIDRATLDTSGNLWVVGDFTTMGGINGLDRIAKWDGAAWAPTEVEFPSGTVLGGIKAIDGDMFIGHDCLGTYRTIVAGPTTTVTNNGSAKAWPILKMKREGGTTTRLMAITNETTGKQLSFNYNMLDGETIEIDLRPGHRRMTSTTHGTAWRLLPGSDVTEFYLRPGDNTIVTLMTIGGSPTLTSFIRWRDTDWSVD